MGAPQTGVRLRQAVVVAAELEPAVQELRSELGLGAPFADPGVADFGLANAVFALGDTFLEVVSPVRAGTAAGRHLERRAGPGGYMVIFQLADLEGARRRADDLEIRVVWQIDLPDISGTHLHPGDIGGAIVSLDRPDPPESWRWGGPDWTGRVGAGAPGLLTGVTVHVTDPVGVATRWAAVLGLPVAGGPRPELELDGSRVAFAPAPTGGAEGLVEIEVVVPPEVRRGRDAVELGGVRFRLRDAPSGSPR